MSLGKRDFPPESGNVDTYVFPCQVGQYETAAGAAYTYLLAHQDHRTMRDNVRFYRAMTEMKPEYFRNWERKQHQVGPFNIFKEVT